MAFEDEQWAGAVRFFVSASEANDVVLALCQALTGRAPLVTGERAYHGGAGLSRDLTVQPQWHGGLSSPGRVAAPPRLAEVRELACPRGSRVSEDPGLALDDAWTSDARAKLEGAAAVLLDYSQGGIYHVPAYQDAVAALARTTGTLWIADETVTGFGRVGGWFQFQHAKSRPDFVTLGKCMTAGGAAGGAVVVSSRVMGLLEGSSWQSYSTYRAHPVAMAALRAHLRVSARDGIPRRACESRRRHARAALEARRRSPERGPDRRPRPALDRGAARPGLAASGGARTRSRSPAGWPRPPSRPGRSSPRAGSRPRSSSLPRSSSPPASST